jgi:iron complex transport system substrate-binding protein
LKDIEQISGDGVDVALRLHRELGPGLLESVYEAILASKLMTMGHSVARQRPIDIEFDNLRFEAAFRIDLLVDERLLVEIKSVERLTAAHGKQLLTYLRLTKQPVGLFGQLRRRDVEGGAQANRERLCPLRVSAPPREPITSFFWRPQCSTSLA